MIAFLSAYTLIGQRRKSFHLIKWKNYNQIKGYKMNEFITMILGQEVQKLMDAKCPSDLACGDDDHWYNERRNRMDKLLLFVEVANGRVDDYDSGDLIAFNKEIMVIVNEKLENIRYNSTEFLEGMVIDKQDHEHFHEMKDAQADPVGQ